MSDTLVATARRMAPAARLRALGSLETRIARLQAEKLAMLAAVDADPVTVSLLDGADKNWAIEDVAVTLRLSPGVARAQLAEAREAVRVPRLLGLLAAGRVTVGHLRAVTDQTIGFDDEVARGIEDRVLDPAATQSVTAFRATVRRAVLTVAAHSLDERRAANVAERRVCIKRAGEGTSELWALLPEEGAAALMTAVHALAKRADRTDLPELTHRGEVRDERTADQRRADALVQLGLDAIAGVASTRLRRNQRLAPAVQVTVALSTLLKLDEQPGELAGIGPVSATVARQLAHDPTGTWRRLVTDPCGRLIDHGRRTYRPPPAIADHVIARDRTCRFPHCTRAAARCDLDHTTPWGNGGTTSAANLAALCPRHHHLRHDTQWRYRPGQNGSTEWIAPTGQAHTTPAATYPSDSTGAPTPAPTDPDPPPF